MRQRRALDESIAKLLALAVTGLCLGVLLKKQHKVTRSSQSPGYCVPEGDWGGRLS